MIVMMMRYLYQKEIVGKITKENRDGTYDILFDDGERKSKVDAKLIKPIAKDKRSLALESRSSEGSARKKPLGSNLRNRMGKKLKLGQRVKTYYNGGSKLKAGKILRMNADGSYDVLFDTGERELRVVRSKLKILNVQPGSIGSTMGSLGELQEIEESGEDQFLGARNYFFL